MVSASAAITREIILPLPEGVTFLYGAFGGSYVLLPRNHLANTSKGIAVMQCNQRSDCCRWYFKNHSNEIYMILFMKTDIQ